MKVPDEFYSDHVKLREVTVPHTIRVLNNRANVWQFQEFLGAGGFGIVLKYKRVKQMGTICGQGSVESGAQRAGSSASVSSGAADGAGAGVPVTDMLKVTSANHGEAKDSGDVSTCYSSSDITCMWNHALVGTEENDEIAVKIVTK